MVNWGHRYIFIFDPKCKLSDTPDCDWHVYISPSLATSEVSVVNPWEKIDYIITRQQFIIFVRRTLYLYLETETTFFALGLMTSI